VWRQQLLSSFSTSSSKYRVFGSPSNIRNPGQATRSIRANRFALRPSRTWKWLLGYGECFNMAGYTYGEKRKQYVSNSALPGSPLLLLLQTPLQPCPSCADNKSTLIQELSTNISCGQEVVFSWCSKLPIYTTLPILTSSKILLLGRDSVVAPSIIGINKLKKALRTDSEGRFMAIICRRFSAPFFPIELAPPSICMAGQLVRE